MDDLMKKVEGILTGPALPNTSFQPIDLPTFKLPKMHSMAEVLADANEPYTAKNIFHQLRTSILYFEKRLDSDHEVGVQLVSFGNTVQFSVSQLGYMDPSLIWFEGILPDGTSTRLIQHTSQLSFLLIAMKRDTETPKRPIGFCAPQCDGE